MYRSVKNTCEIIVHLQVRILPGRRGHARGLLVGTCASVMFGFEKCGSNSFSRNADHIWF